jgi:hypothetical protein
VCKIGRGIFYFIALGQDAQFIGIPLHIYKKTARQYVYVIQNPTHNMPLVLFGELHGKPFIYSIFDNWGRCIFCNGSAVK